jgi:protein phosphatase
MDRTVQKANTEIHTSATENPSQKGMGTTLTAGVVTGGRLFISQVGDSRAYLLRKGLSTSSRRTSRSSVSSSRRDADRGGGGEARRRNIVLQAVGVEESLRVDTKYWPVLRGDVLLVCSDGLSGMVKDRG